MIKIGIICDPVSADIDRDFVEIEERLNLLELPIKISMRATGMHEARDRRFDVLIIDYGAMSFGAQSTGEWQIRAACEWAENHPGSLLVLWTWHTQRLYERELESQFGHIQNAILRYDGDTQLKNTLSRWFVADTEGGVEKDHAKK